MHKILKEKDIDWFKFIHCSNCNKTVLFIKEDRECSKFNCCLVCLPLYQKVKIILEDLSTGCFNFDLEKKVSSKKTYSRSDLVAFLVSKVGLEDIVNYLKDEIKIDILPMPPDFRIDKDDMLGSSYTLPKPKYMKFYIKN